MRKVFLEELPRWEDGRYKGKINWKECVGYKVRFIYDDIEGWVEIVGYKAKGQYLYITYQNTYNFKIIICSFRKCQLGELLEKRTNKFKIEIGTRYNDNKKDITITDREYRENPHNEGKKQKWYKYICNKCGYEDYKIESDLIKGSGCGCCGYSSKTVIEGINDIPTTAPWMIKYFQGGIEEAKLYTKCSAKPIKPVCPDCGRVKPKKMAIYNIYNKKSIGCTCGDGFSYGHKYIYNVLTQLNIDFEDNKRFDWCKFSDYKDKNKQTYGEYDFFVENMKLIIEVDGDWHRKDNYMSGQTKKHSEYLDDMKDKLANENGYKIIRISDEDNIKDNILNSKLVDILNLNNIDWLICEKFALSNRVKVACELKKNNPNITTGDIGKIMKLDPNTVAQYLKKGADLGWCKYNPKEEQLKNAKKSGKMLKDKLSKPIEILKDGISMGIFESSQELTKKSEELFGVKLWQGRISLICNGKKKTYKGFTFKYV